MKYDEIVAAWDAQKVRFHTWETLPDRERIEFALSLAGKVEKQEPVACSHCDGTGDVHSFDGEWRGECDCGAAQYHMLDRLLRDSLGDDDYAEYSAALNKVSAPQPVEKQEPVAYRVETGYEQPFYWYSDTLPTRGKWSALYTDPQPCPECEERKTTALNYISLTFEFEQLQSKCENLKANGLVFVTKEDAESYCRILTLLGMEEEGSPIEEVERLLHLREGMVCADCQDTGWLENRIEGKYPCTCMTEAEPYQLLEAECEKLKAERGELAVQVTHWKANHASVVEQARILKERTDMPIERVKAYETWVAMAAHAEKMREALSFYAEGSHFVLADPEAWDTVSGEPPNYYEDEANTATVEDGSIAKAALALPDLTTSVLNRVRADALDAKRYRWLRSSSVGPAQIWELLSDDCNPPVMTLKSMDDLDAAIDRALAADMEEGK